MLFAHFISLLERDNHGFPPYHLQVFAQMPSFLERPYLIALLYFMSLTLNIFGTYHPLIFC